MQIGMAMDQQTGNSDKVHLISLAVRIALLIVGPTPVLVLALVPAAILELIVELATGDSFYYQQHRWCPYVGCLISGSLIFLLRRVPFLEHGIWIGPLLFVLGAIQFLR